MYEFLTIAFVKRQDRRVRDRMSRLSKSATVLLILLRHILTSYQTIVRNNLFERVKAFNFNVSTLFADKTRCLTSQKYDSIKPR